jgi:3-oxoacyl-[acyl-carrier protein] reductase
MKRVLVTGSSRGIGKAIADALKAEGYAVVTHSVRSGGTDLQFDISDREAAAAALSADIEKNGPYYGVVLNAGVNSDNVFPAMKDEEWDRVIGTNLDGFYNVLKPCLMPMISARIKGRIIAMSSVAGIMGNRGQVNYSAAKAGMVGAVKALAVEVARRGITVNAIAPGLIETEMIDSMVPQAMEAAMNMIPMRRVGRTDEISSLVSYLLSESAGYLTRQVISVNGGMY